MNEKVEGLIKRKIRTLLVNREEIDRLRDDLKINNSVIVWNERKNIDHYPRDCTLIRCNGKND